MRFARNGAVSRANTDVPALDERRKSRRSPIRVSFAHEAVAQTAGAASSARARNDAGVTADRHFEVVVALEVDEDVPVADVLFRGTQVADVRKIAGEYRCNLYSVAGEDGAVPLDALVEALDRAKSSLD